MRKVKYLAHLMGGKGRWCGMHSSGVRDHR